MDREITACLPTHNPLIQTPLKRVKNKPLLLEAWMQLIGRKHAGVENEAA
jgi:hypothetical protein